MGLDKLSELWESRRAFGNINGLLGTGTGFCEQERAFGNTSRLYCLKSVGQSRLLLFRPLCVNVFASGTIVKLGVNY